MGRAKRGVSFTFFDWVTGREFIRWGWRWILRHLVIAIFAGLVLLFMVYFLILRKRVGLPDGYYSSPTLTTLSELVWFGIGAFLYLLFSILKKRKNKNKRR